MTTFSIRFPRLALLGLLWLGLSCALLAEPAFIAHPGVSQPNLSADEIESILTGKLTKWKDGSTITVVLLNDGATHEEVCRNFAKRTTDQLEKHWKKLVFTGKGRAPVSAKSDAEAADLVAKTPGAFGYAAKDSAGTVVKVLKVD